MIAASIGFLMGFPYGRFYSAVTFPAEGIEKPPLLSTKSRLNGASRTEFNSVQQRR
jgi:hypothetical protein